MSADLDTILAAARDDIVNDLDAAMGQCPHDGVSSEWDLCNACAADTAIKAVREAFAAARPETAADLVAAVEAYARSLGWEIETNSHGATEGQHAYDLYVWPADKEATA